MGNGVSHLVVSPSGQTICALLLSQTRRVADPGIQLTQQTGLRSDTGICHSGQAKRSAGISSFRHVPESGRFRSYPAGKPE